MSRPADIERPKAILFDWDNTLVNTWPTIIECYRDTFKALGQTPWTDQQVRDRAHGSLRDQFPKLFGARAGEAEKVFYGTFRRIHLERLEPLPGAERLLERAAMVGCYVALVSNKVGDNLRDELAHLGWGRWISKAVGAKEAIETEVVEHRLQTGDVALLCSDGLHSMINDEHIRAAVTPFPAALPEAAQKLIDAANEAGGKDNVSVVLLRYSD